MTTGRGFICASCVRYRGWDQDHPKAHCAAFPDGIPDALIYGLADHRQPIEGDHGIRYVLDPDRRDTLVAYEKAKAEAVSA